MTALNIGGTILGGLPLNQPSTSGAYYNFSVTRDQIIRQAMLDMGALQEAEVPTAEETTDMARLLNMITKQWMGNTDFAPGLKVWTRKRGELFLSPSQYVYSLGQSSPDNWVESTTGLSYPNKYGQTNVSGTVAAGTTVIPVASTSQLNINDYIGFLIGGSIFWTTVSNIGVGTVTIPAPGLTGGIQANGASYVWNYTKKGVRPLALITATLRDIYFNDTPLRIFTTVEEYEALPTKAAPTNIADPTAVLYESHFKSQNPSGRLYLDVGGAQDVTKHLHLTHLAPTEDFLNPGDAPDYPQQWYDPLTLELAKRGAPMFDCAWTPDLEELRKAAIAIAQQGDPEQSSTYFVVDGDDPYGP
jgi:hypothetical protein